MFSAGPAGWLLSVAMLAGGPALPDPQPSPASPGLDAPVVLSVERVVVRSPGTDPAELARELRLRAPKLEVIIATEGDQGVLRPPFAHVLLYADPIDDQRHRLSLVRSAGDAYDRSFAVPEKDLARVAATMIIGLLAAPAMAPEDAASPTRPDTIDAGTDQDPLGPAEPDAPATDPAAATTAATPRPPAHELGVFVAGGPIMGFGPPAQLDGLVAGAISIGAIARWKRGAVVAAEMRLAPRLRAGYLMMRDGLFAHGGFAWRFTRLDLQVTAFFGFERFWLRKHGRKPDLRQRDAGDGLLPWILGAGLRVAPGWSIEREVLTTRVRVFTSFAGSAMPRGGVAHVLIPDARGIASEGFRIGGFEWLFGVDVAWTFRLRNAAGPKRTNRGRGT